MADELVAATSLTSWIAADKPLQAYYRSKLFSVHHEDSPFVSAASPVFSLLDRFVVATTLPPIERVMVNLDHELKAFHSRLLSLPYTEKQNAMAYYLLTATIDEVLARSYLRLYGRAVAFQAFTPASYADEPPATQFFLIIRFLKMHPLEHLPLLELAYYCLMAGFEGEQQGRVDGRQVLEAEIDSLFHMIEQYRQHPQILLFNDKPKTEEAMPKPYRRLIIAGSLMILLLVFCYHLSQLFLEHRAKSLRFAQTFLTTLDE